MGLKIYNPLSETLVDVGTIKSKPKLVPAKKFDGMPEILTYYPEKKLFFISKGKPKIFGDKEFYLFNKDTIESLVIKDASKKIEKSVITRTIIGGLLAGSVGAIVGGMSGLEDDYKYFKQVIINDNLKFSFDEKEYLKIKDFFDEVYDELSEKKKVMEKEAEIKNNTVEMLKQLKELFDLGIITQEEFNEKKEKLLKQI